MTRRVSDAQDRRDQAVRDLLDLDQQVATGELGESDAQPLRAQYETAAAAAINALEERSDVDVEPPAGLPPRADDPRPGGPRRLRGRHVAYVMGLAAAVLTVVLVTGSTSQRPDGGFVTGNEATAGPTPEPKGRTPAEPAAGGDLAGVTLKQLEAVVAANPEVTGMRLALAARYTAQGKYDLATVHYKKVLARQPRSAEALAHLGWIAMLAGDPQRAAEYVDRAVAQKPVLPDALWFQANIRLFGLDDPRGALVPLRELAQRDDLTPAVTRQVDGLRRLARQQEGR